MARTATPFGSWPSPLAAAQLARAGRRPSQPRWQGEHVYWLERRPEDAGRQVVVRARPGGGVEEVTPAGVNVRSLVHEYGGGDYGFVRGELVFASLGEPGVQRLAGAPLTSGPPGACYADFAGSPDGRWLVAVEEQPTPPGATEPRNRLVAFDLASGRRTLVIDGQDFVSTPRFDPRGDQLACLVWSHPDMPWDATRLLVLPWSRSGPAGPPRQVAGGGAESIFQPGFSPRGRITFVSDRSGWWNLYQERDATVRALCPRSAEFGLPQWVFGMSTWGFVDEETLLCTVVEAGLGRLARLSLADGRLETLALPFTAFDGLSVDAGRAAFVGMSPDRVPTVCALEVASGRVRELTQPEDLALEPADVSAPEPLRFASEAGREAHAFLYRPCSRRFEGPPRERPPLLVKSHGGPTSFSPGVLRPDVQYWTSRGFAVIDVNYGGSSGYGRDYRNLLRGAWGVVDVDDCCAAATFLARSGVVDPARLAITGGSAGGYTTLCALTFRDVFQAGASYYGIGDLEALARDTHKFESRYLDRLVGPYPERRDLYVARSPIHHSEQLGCPVVFFQGLEDRVVPPAQAEAMVAALATRGVMHAYLAFAGEQHGFRRAENIRAALEGELCFYGRVFGFATDAPLEIPIVPGRVSMNR